MKNIGKKVGALVMGPWAGSTDAPEPCTCHRDRAATPSPRAPGDASRAGGDDAQAGDGPETEWTRAPARESNACPLHPKARMAVKVAAAGGAVWFGARAARAVMRWIW